MRGGRELLPGKDDFVFRRERAVVVEALEGDSFRREAERVGPEVEATLLERHEAGGGEEAAPERPITGYVHVCVHH